MAKSIGIGAEELARKAAASGKNDAAKAAASGDVKPQPKK